MSKNERRAYTVESFNKGLEAEDIHGKPVKILTVESGIEHYPIVAIIDGFPPFKFNINGMSPHGTCIYEREMTLEQRVVQWANDKGIMDNSKPINQCFKLHEEVTELGDELMRVLVDRNKARMELGDVLVVSTILADMLDTTTDKCLQMAYDKIIKRSGRMVDGVFVKDD